MPDRLSLLCLVIAAALFPAAANAASVRVEETDASPNHPEQHATLIFEAGSNETNQLTVEPAGEDSGKVRYSLHDTGAALASGPGCSGGGPPGTEVTCLLSRSRPRTCDGVICWDYGREVTLGFELGDADDSFDATALPAGDGGGGSFEVNVQGASGADSIVTGATRDTIDPGPGADTVQTGDGVDAVAAGASPDGADVFDLGPGFDTLSYAGATATLSVSLNGIADDGAAGEGDNVLAAERVVGGEMDDRLIGSDSVEPGPDGWAEILEGGGGADVMIGNGGPDLLYDISDVGSGLDDDVFRGGRGRDHVLALSGGDDLATGGLGADSLSMETGNDRASGGPGRDHLDGGPGSDLLRGGRGLDRVFAGFVGGDGAFGETGDGAPDRLDCGSSARDHAFDVDPHDRAQRCERVKRAN